MGRGCGYAGYVPAKIATVLTHPLDLACKRITKPETFDTLKKVTQNVAQQPAEPKFRKLKLTNEKIKALFVDVDGALDALLELGWVQEEEEGAAVLVLPPAKHLTMAHVRQLDAAHERLTEALKAKARSDSAARSRSADPAREALRLQIEADKRERAARGPVTVGSVAVPRAEFGAKAAGPSGPIAGDHGHGHSHGGPVRHVHDAAAWRGLQDESARSGKALLVDFTASWCGPCKMIAPAFEELAAKHSSIIFAKVDVDECQEVASACGVSAMPTFQLYKNGVKAGECKGANLQALQALVASA